MVQFQKIIYSICGLAIFTSSIGLSSAYTIKSQNGRFNINLNGSSTIYFSKSLEKYGVNIYKNNKFSSYQNHNIEGGKDDYDPSYLTISSIYRFSIRASVYVNDDYSFNLNYYNYTNSFYPNLYYAQDNNFALSYKDYGNLGVALSSASTINGKVGISQPLTSANTVLKVINLFVPSSVFYYNNIILSNDKGKIVYGGAFGLLGQKPNNSRPIQFLSAFGAGVGLSEEESIIKVLSNYAYAVDYAFTGKGVNNFEIGVGQTFVNYRALNTYNLNGETISLDPSDDTNSYYVYSDKEIKASDIATTLKLGYSFADYFSATTHLSYVTSSTGMQEFHVDKYSEHDGAHLADLKDKTSTSTTIERIGSSKLSIKSIKVDLSYKPLMFDNKVTLYVGGGYAISSLDPKSFPLSKFSFMKNEKNIFSSFYTEINYRPFKYLTFIAGMSHKKNIMYFSHKSEGLLNINNDISYNYYFNTTLSF